MKKAIVNFPDGAKEVTVGDKVFVVEGGRRGCSYLAEITAIGRTLVTVTHFNRETKYYLEDGHQKSDLNPNILYSSEKEYRIHCLEEKLRSDITTSLSWSEVSRVPTDKLLRIQKILQTEKYKSGEFDDLHAKYGTDQKDGGDHE